MTTPTVAFFGATGDCAGYCLSSALKAGFNCIALARTPSKLTNSMKAKGVSTTTLDSHLTIVSGDVKDVSTVQTALQLNGRVVDYIVSGIGGLPKLQWSLWEPVTLNDPTICQDAGATILRALQGLQVEQKPTFINVSTTGISPRSVPRDVPLLFVPLYHWFLSVPHADKQVLEEKLAAHTKLPEKERGLRAYVNVKPSLLMDGAGCGLQAVRVGVDEKPAVGYTIQRKDVGTFMFERLVKTGVPQEWLNKSVSVTY
ncbi:hypothetical protein BDY17DRAFT_302384 [Neohortaea acidophila]|uniref:NAD(P)-binding domain-containing protein n=1 Tax=Neohortaea acidophila TaxID=245834 RepID=A0A6A6PL38_9PEZI|nr:uncharacterized protein BDY17DRAFT_302384 [Neohortaea acidophila]KAF2480780.1 hypothetical protein BDY17DRAFT_302384 [Neohortaea acidophila]